MQLWNENTGEKTSIETAITTSVDTANPNLEVTLTVKVAEIHRLRDCCRKLEQSECSLKEDLSKLRRDGNDMKQELTRAQLEKQALEKDLDLYITKSNVRQLLMENLFLDLEI